MMILETVLSDRYVCQISCFSPQVKYLDEFFMLAAKLKGKWIEVIFALFNTKDSWQKVKPSQTDF